jgi:hypothetical protein
VRHIPFDPKYGGRGWEVIRIDLDVDTYVGGIGATEKPGLLALLRYSLRRRVPIPQFQVDGVLSAIGIFHQLPSLLVT